LERDQVRGGVEKDVRRRHRELQRHLANELHKAA
jgi:hypothetical protein